MKPSVTNAAKDFLQSTNKSSAYVDAVEATVSDALAAAERRIQREVKRHKAGKRRAG